MKLGKGTTLICIIFIIPLLILTLSSDSANTVAETDFQLHHIVTRSANINPVIIITEEQSFVDSLNTEFLQINSKLICIKNHIKISRGL